MKAETPMRKKRREIGLTVMDVSRQTNIPYSTCYFLDAGRGTNFNPAIKKKIADALGVDFFSLWPEELKKIHHVQMFTKPEK